MPYRVAVVYPSQSFAGGTGQHDIGGFEVPTASRLFRVEVHGKVNFAGVSVPAGSIEANWLLWAVQFVPHGVSPSNILTTADGPEWLIRQQTGDQESRVSWSPTTGNGEYLAGYPLDAFWAGQYPSLSDFDLWISVSPPSGANVGAFNINCSIRFWWT